MISKAAKRLISLMLVAVMVFALAATAFAADSYTGVYAAKDDIAKVEITQYYNGKLEPAATHNYAIQGNDVSIDYEASLYMTEEMATYLQARQRSLMDAKFNVCFRMDMEKLSFDEDVVVDFSSTFLKPQENDGVYSYRLLSEVGGVYTYRLTVSKEAAEDPANWLHKSTWSDGTWAFVIPMELIVYYDGTTAYGFDEAKQSFADQPLMYANFTVEDWMHEIKLSMANLHVKDEVRESITLDRKTWVTIFASGTVDGEFTYNTGEPVNTIGGHVNWAAAGFTNTLEFGNEDTIEEWTSNEVQVRLIKFAGGTGASPWLNLEDHFAYIIGYPDNTVRPQGTITRAEVATIFFRMLNDETREFYWSTTNRYNDVSQSDWYNNAISTLTKLGVLTGYPDGGFHPQANITRAEFATMAVRFFDVTGKSTSVNAFSDIAGHWAAEYINMAYLLEIVNGYPDGTFRPQKAITRAEAMTIVNNTLRRTPCVEGIKPVAQDMITWPDNMDTTQWYYAAVQEATNSHEYTYFASQTTGTTQLELWQRILPVRDWAAFEKAWSTANSASNPGEVVDGTGYLTQN